MALTREEVLHIARLARLGLSEEEMARFQEQLSHILDHFNVLQELDTSQVPPTAYPTPLQNVFRQDEAAPSLPAHQVLANAPRQEDSCFKVRAILE